jgi:hypothetical protein
MSGTNSRAQTTLDFAIAMGIFLLAVAFVFTFIPSLTSPFVDSNQERSVVADRTASHLAEGALGDPNRPLIVEEACATAFFGNKSVPTECDGFGDGKTHERLGLSPDIGFNISLVHVNASASGKERYRTVCIAEDGESIIHEGDSDKSCDKDLRYTIGDEPRESDSVTVARRIVTVENCEFEGADACDATLLVEVY